MSLSMLLSLSMSKSFHTIKGGSRRKVLVMMKAAKQGWAGAGAGKKQGWTKKGQEGQKQGRAGQEEGRSRNWARVG